MVSTSSSAAVEKVTRRRIGYLAGAFVVALLCFIPAIPAAAATGPNNSITDVPGVIVGHSTRIDARTGTTAIIFPNGGKMGFGPTAARPAIGSPRC